MQHSKTLPAFSIKHQQALACLSAGHVLSCPTEAVWGLSCDPFNIHAVARLLALKNRPAEKGLIVAFASFSQLDPFLDDSLSPEQLSLLQAPSDAATTWLVPIKANSIAKIVTGKHDRLAVRISRHPVLNQLCQDYGPLVSTSANPGGSQAAKEQFQVRRYFGDAIAYCQGRVGAANKPSTIKDLISQQVLRD